MHIHIPSSPVEYNGSDTLSLRKLADFCSSTNANFSELQSTLVTVQLRLNEVNATNKQLTQLLNWIAVTNPQILDEFQTTAHAFDKLVPREPGEFAGPQSAA